MFRISMPRRPPACAPRRIARWAACAWLAAGCAPHAAEIGPRREAIAPPGVAPLAAYSPAVRAGGLVFFAGVIGTLPDGRGLAPGGVQAETRQALDNLAVVMRAAGVAVDDIVKCTVFLADIADFRAMNEVYAEFFRIDPPARSTVGAAGLPAGASVEIECIALAPRR